jgi:peptide/nickel transport system substrate-binding protein
MDKLNRKRALRLRFRRRLRLQKRQVEELGAQAERRLENDFFKRLERLGRVRRFIVSWILLVVLLIGTVAAQSRSLSGYYQASLPAPGGTYTEGVLGAFTNANPIYATDLADTTVSELLFAGLLTFNEQNQLAGDLAESFAVDAVGTTYTVRLRPGLTWHDGQPLTSDDVLFTYQVIQNPDARSPLYGSWKDIAVKAVDPLTVTFTLPNTLAPFPYSLTTGIVPRHILGDTAMLDMRSVPFNSVHPVGAGPFKWQAIELSGGTADRRQETIALAAFDKFHAGEPKLNNFVIRTFRSPEQLLKSFEAQEVTAIAGLTQVPLTLQGDGGVRVYNLPLTAAVMTFFRTQNGLLANSKIRQALVQGADTGKLISTLQYPTRPVRGPLLLGQQAYDARFQQAAYNFQAAAKLLDDDGWKADPAKDGQRYKDGQPLSFSLHFLNSSEYTSVARQLAQQWRILGVDVKLEAEIEADFQAILASAPSGNEFSYDALLYGISIGPDPDVYVYWHSSQTDALSPVRLNFSEYKSSMADDALVAGRTRLDPALRAAKYQPFLQAWQADAPALSLYQPRFLYITHGAVHGLNESTVNSDVGRFKNVHNWQIRERWETLP